MLVGAACKSERAAHAERGRTGCPPPGETAAALKEKAGFLALKHRLWPARSTGPSCCAAGCTARYPPPPPGRSRSSPASSSTPPASAASTRSSRARRPGSGWRCVVVVVIHAVVLVGHAVHAIHAVLVVVHVVLVVLVVLLFMLSMVLLFGFWMALRRRGGHTRLPPAALPHHTRVCSRSRADCRW